MKKALRFFSENLGKKTVLYLLINLVFILLPLANILQTDYLRQVIDDLYDGLYGPLPGLLLAVILFQIGRSVVRYLCRITAHNCSQSCLLTVRRKLYKNLQEQSMEYYQTQNTGDLMARVSGDLDMVRFALSYYFPMIGDAILTFVSTLVYLLRIHVRLSLLLTVFTPLIFFLTARMAKTIRPMFRKIREENAVLNAIVQENIEGNRAVKAYSREEYEIRKFDLSNEELRDKQIGTELKSIWYSTPITAIATLMAAIALIVGGFFAIRGELTIGDLSTFVSLSWSLSVPLRTLTNLVNDTQRIGTALERIYPIYELKPTIVSRPDALPAGDIRGRITFDRVSLTLGEQPIIRDLSFDILPGQKIGIMGPTGSGKTFLTNLLLRLYDVTSGQILIDGTDLRDYELHQIRKKIAVATQDVFLFSETIESNICYGDPELEMSGVIEAAEHAAASRFIRHTESGYDTIIGERGVGLSGGQKQRLALARAFAVKAPVLILDDTTSALDMETEKEIQESLDRYYSGTTRLIIAQRISSVRNADRILILDHGTVVDSGTHEELFSRPGYYRDIYRLQYGPESEAEIQ